MPRSGIAISDTATPSFIAPGTHLTPHSDLVALLVLEHQVRITNLITRVGWEARMALADHASLRLPNEPAPEWSASTRRRIEGPAEVLVRSLFMLDAHALTAAIAQDERAAIAEILKDTLPVFQSR